MAAAMPILVTATFAPGDDGWLQELRRTHYPPELNRVPAHLTLFRLLPPSVEGELGRRLAFHAASPPPRAAIGGIMDLGEGAALRIDSEELDVTRGLTQPNGSSERIQIPDTEYHIDFWRDVDHEGIGGQRYAGARNSRTHESSKKSRRSA